MFAFYSFINQGIKFIGVGGFVGPQNHQFPAPGNDRRMSLQSVVGQLAEGTLCFAETAGFYF